MKPKDAIKKILELINKFSKLKDTALIFRNLLCFYIQITNYQKEKLTKSSYLQLHNKNNIKYLGGNKPRK